MSIGAIAWGGVDVRKKFIFKHFLWSSVTIRGRPLIIWGGRGADFRERNFFFSATLRTKFFFFAVPPNEFFFSICTMSPPDD